MAPCRRLGQGEGHYAYARFLTDEVEALWRQGKRVKVFFLLRDAYLLSRMPGLPSQTIGRPVRRQGLRRPAAHGPVHRIVQQEEAGEHGEMALGGGWEQAPEVQPVPIVDGRTGKAIEAP
jgi:hypothetical protein